MVKPKNNFAPVTKQCLDLIKSVPTKELESIQTAVLNQYSERALYDVINKLNQADVISFFQDVEGIAISANKTFVCEMLPVMKQLALDGMPVAYNHEDE